MARLVAEEGLDLDVATGGELHVALHAGFPAERIVFHGNNKSTAELRARARRRRRPDRRRLVRRARPARGARRRRAAPRRRARARHARASRRTPTSTSRPAPKTRSSGSASRTATRSRAVRRVVDGGALRFAGLHCHIGSQVFRLDSFARAVDKMVGLVRDDRERDRRDRRRAEPRRRSRRALPRRATTAPTIAQYARARAATSSRKALADAGVRSRPALMVEPGRSIAAPAGLTLYTVGTIKEIAGRAHLRRGRRRHERQPAARSPTARATRRSSRPARRAPRPLGRDGRGQALRAGRHARARRAAARRRRGGRHARDAGHRRVRALDGVQLQQGRCARRWCSCATARPASSCAARTHDDLVRLDVADPLEWPDRSERRVVTQWTTDWCGSAFSGAATSARRSSACSTRTPT